MQLPSIFQGESLTRLLQGTAFGAVAAMVVGFNWGGWVLGSTAETQAKNSAKSAVVTALAPICANKFQQEANMAENMASLKKASSYQQATFIEKGGWATLEGTEKASSGVGKACAALLIDLK